MILESKPLPIDIDVRMRFHAIFAEWLNQANEEEYRQLEAARERFAPNQVCSAVSLISGCLAREELRPLLPDTLCLLLQERNWPQADAAAQAL